MSASARFIVVGGGVVAASVAYHLARRGASVIIVAGGQRGAATSAGAGIICPWTAPLDDASYRLCAEGARYYPELLAMLADDGEAGGGYARVGALCVAGQAQALRPVAALLRSRRTSAPDVGEVAALAPGEPARMFPPLAPGSAGLAPGLRAAELVETRIGFRPVTGDGRPLLGPLDDGLIVATGHGPEGLTAGPWSGLAVALLALGQPRSPTLPRSTRPGSRPDPARAIIEAANGPRAPVMDVMHAGQPEPSHRIQGRGTGAKRGNQACPGLPRIRCCSSRANRRFAQ